MAVEGAVVPEDRELRALLGQVHTIAVVGLVALAVPFTLMVPSL